MAVVRRLSRRMALGGAAAVCLGSVVAGCRRTAAGTGVATGGVLPVPASGVVHLVFQPNVQFIPWNPTTQAIYQEFVDKNFNTNPKFKGIWCGTDGIAGFRHHPTP
jgi:hypothetical protein